MWPWKKSKPEPSRPDPETNAVPPPLMGIVYRPPQPREQEPDEKKEGGEEGTSDEARAVSAGMEPTNRPRPNAFDASKAAPSTLIPLQSVQIATPCRADWSKMEGDDKSRFCQTCQKSVYNLSAMTTGEAQALIAAKGGDLCARLYRRADGTIITGDCPVGKTAARRPFWTLGAGFAALMGWGALLTRGASGASEPAIVQLPITTPSLSARLSSRISNLINPRVEMGAASYTPSSVMGRIACPKPTAAPAPTQAPEPPRDPSAPEMGEIAPSAQA